MDIHDARQLAERLMAQHGITCELRFNHSKKSHGSCHHKADGTGEIHTEWIRGRARRVYNMVLSHIELSLYFISLNDEARVASTILHEICHALLPASEKHGMRWRLLARKLGHSGERTSAAEHVKGRYQAICKCGKTFDLHRKTKNFTRYICPLCREKLVFVENFWSQAAADLSK